MLYKAQHRFADMGPRKMRPFAHLIYGKNVDVAIEALRFYPNRGARLIEGVLKSAYGNAEDAIRYVKELENAGADEIMCMIQMGTLSQDIMLETIRQFGTNVIPHFRAQNAAN